jgi:hypothetical protein
MNPAFGLPYPDWVENRQLLGLFRQTVFFNFLGGIFTESHTTNMPFNANFDPRENVPNVSAISLRAEVGFHATVRVASSVDACAFRYT